MLLRESVARIAGEEPRPDLVLVRFVDGRPVNYPLAEVEELPADSDEWYVAGGVFAPGSVTPHAGRSGENVREVLWLQLDADLADVMGVSKETLWALPQEELDALVEDLLAAFVTLCDEAGVPVHEIVRTGYGLCGYVRVDAQDRERVQRLRAVHAGIVRRVNELADGRFLDPAVTDSGSRFTRVPGTINRKGGGRREVEVVWSREGRATLDQLVTFSRPAADEPRMPRVIPDHGRPLEGEEFDALVETLAGAWQTYRHKLAQGVAGMLAKAGVPQPEAEALVQAVCAAAADEEFPDRLRVVRDTYDRARSGAEVSGWHVLRAFAPAAVADRVDRVVSRYRERNRARLVRSSQHTARYDSSPPLAFQVSPLPEECKRGLVWEWVEEVSPTTEASDNFLLACWLTVLGASVGRRVCSSYMGKLWPNLYTCLVGGTAVARKDHAIGIALNTVRHWAWQGEGRVLMSGPMFSVIEDISSGAGALKALEDNAQVLAYLTELTDPLDKSEGRGSTIKDFLIRASNNPEVLENNSIATKVRIERPSFSVLAATQPARLSKRMTEEAVTSGFANRWLWVYPERSKGPKPDPEQPDMGRLAALFSRWWTNVRLLEQAGHPLDRTAEARLWWDDWYNADYALKDSLDEVRSDLRGRAHVLAQKLGLIYAVADDSNVVTLDHLRAGAAFVDWCWKNVSRECASWGATGALRDENRVTQAMHRNGPMTKREIVRAAHMAAQTVDQVLKALASAEMVGLDEEGRWHLLLD